MSNFEFIPKGICAKKFEFSVEGNIVQGFKSQGGCPGNLLGLEAAIKDKTCEEIIAQFKNIKCGARETSCPMQISIALEEFCNQINP